tara:strand:+ start:246 stop:473 length:228 start_codon:yes stop_codon:yes gene_type:complete
MKIFLHLILFIFIINCSLNSESKYWTEDTIKKKTENKKLIEIIGKSNDIRSMTVDEYEIYIDDYIKKSKYPDINE